MSPKRSGREGNSQVLGYFRRLRSWACHGFLIFGRLQAMESFDGRMYRAGVGELTMLCRTLMALGPR